MSAVIGLVAIIAAAIITYGWKVATGKARHAERMRMLNRLDEVFNDSLRVERYSVKDETEAKLRKFAQAEWARP